MKRSWRIALQLVWMLFLILVLTLFWRAELDYVYRAF